MGRGRRVCALQHLDAVVEAVADKDVALAADYDAVKAIKLAKAAARGADCFHVGTVGVAKELHTVIGAVGDNDVASAIERKADRVIKLPVSIPGTSNRP